MSDKMNVGDRLTVRNVECTVGSVDDFAPVKIKQNRGPTIEFEGRLLASTEWEAREGDMRIELYQTKGGALIPVTRSTFEDGRRGLVSAVVVEPIYHAGERVEVDGDKRGWRLADVPGELDHAAMRFAVMDHFDWTDRARSMVRDHLGWTLKRVVE